MLPNDCMADLTNFNRIKLVTKRSYLRGELLVGRHQVCALAVFKYTVFLSQVLIGQRNDQSRFIWDGRIKPPTIISPYLL